MKLGGSTYELATNVGDTCRWTPSATKWGPRVPNSTSEKCTMIVDTYNGSTKIGTNSYDFTLYVPANIVPAISSLSVSIVNDNTTVNSWGIAVKGYTKLQWSADASGAAGSSIESWAFTAGGLTGAADSGTTGIIQTAGSITPSIKVTDTRDRTATKTAASITVYDYAAPNVTNASAYRCDADGNADDSGTNVRITLTAHISSVNGKNSATLQYRYKQAGGSFNGWTAFSSGTILSGFDAAKSYEFELRTVDALGNAKSTTITVPTESVWLNGRDGGKGAAFGKYAEEDNLFDVAWNSRFRGKVTFDEIPEQVASSAEFHTLNNRLGGFRAKSINVAAGSSVKIAIDAHLFMIGRYAAAASTPAVYAFSAYSKYRAPVMAQLSEGMYISVAIAGDDTNGWYIEISNTGATTVLLYFFGNAEAQVL